MIKTLALEKQAMMSAPSADMICGRPLLQRRSLANEFVSRDDDVDIDCCGGF